MIRDLPDCLRRGDLLVANNSRVLPARLKAEKARTGGRVELLLLNRTASGAWNALAKPARRLNAGTELSIISRPPNELPGHGTVESIGLDGAVVVRLSGAVESDLGRYGEMPLPPYIRSALGDQERYQTVYAAAEGSAAAPTAGLHVTPALLERLGADGIGWAEVTLHVGLDTFRPMTAERVADHRIHHEWCDVSDETAQAIAQTRMAGGRIVAIGTTSARTIETLGAAFDNDRPRGYSGETGIFITPGYEWRLVDALLTNFHLPHSTLLAMVSALVGWHRLRDAYEVAIAERYRFFSFGDAMLII
jgi:S-adenosylmethionine:tRNA ribosyltransferase-isomerase